MRWVAFGLVGIAPVLLLSGHLRARLARSAVGGLFVDLVEISGPAELERALSRALRDPSLTLAYWLPEFGSYADPEGRAVELPEPERRPGGDVHRARGTRVAALLHDPSLEDEPELLDAVTARCGHRARERAAPRGAASAAGGAARVAGAHRRRRPRMSVSAWSATSTTGHSSGSLRCRSSWACWKMAFGATPTRAGDSTGEAGDRDVAGGAP